MANFPPFIPSSSDEDRKAKHVQLVLNLTNFQLRPNALLQLSQISLGEFFEDLPPIVWHSIGTATAVLQEIISAYHPLSSEDLTLEQSSRVKIALYIFQGLAYHSETKMLFLNAYMPCYVYPFLTIRSNSSPLEDLRIASLSVVATLMRPRNTDVIAFLLESELVRYCLQSIDNGSLKSKAIATLILLWILEEDQGLSYICTTIERFYAVVNMLTDTLTVLAGAPSAVLVGDQQGDLLSHIIRCFFQLSRNPTACSTLQRCLPNMLRDGTFSNFFRDNPELRLCLEQLLQKVRGVSRFVPEAGACHQVEGSSWSLELKFLCELQLEATTRLSRIKHYPGSSQ